MIQIQKLRCKLQIRLGLYCYKLISNLKQQVFQQRSENAQEYLQDNKFKNKFENQRIYMVGQIFTFIINIKYKMTSRFASKLQKEQSQFRIDQISRKKKGGIQNKNHRYSIITYQKRVQLINLASSKGYSISRAARELGIKPSTGKFIVKCFRDNGKIMKKTQNQQLKSGNNCQECSGTETGDHKSDLGEKNSINLKQPISASDNNFKFESENMMSNQNRAQMYLFGYQYEQPVINHMIFYPSFQNLGGMVMPLYFSQNVQY